MIYMHNFSDKVVDLDIWLNGDVLEIKSTIEDINFK